MRHPSGPRKFGGNPKQAAKLRELNKKLADRKSYYKRKYGDTTLLEIQTTGVSSFTYLKEFNQYIKNIEAALQKEIRPTHYRNIHKTLIPINEVNQARKEFKRINQLKAERLMRLDEHGVLVGGKIISVADAIKAGDKRFEDLKPLKFDINRFKSEKAFIAFMDKFKEVHKDDFFNRWDEDYRGSYLEALKRKIGVYSELGSDYTRLKKHIENMDIKTFMKTYYTKDFVNIHFLYDKTQAKLKINKLLTEWNVPEEEQE